MSSEEPHSSGEHASGDDAHAAFDDAVSPLASSIAAPHGSRFKRQASRTLSGRMSDDPDLSPLAAQHAETKHAHLEGDIHASGAAAAGHQGGGHKAGSSTHSSEEDAPEGPTSGGAGARDDALSMMMQRQMSLTHMETVTQAQGAADGQAGALATPPPAKPAPVVAPVHSHGTRRSAAAAAAAAEVSGSAGGHGGEDRGAPSRCGFVFDARMLEHVPPEDVLHFEQPGRVRAIFKRLHSEGLIAACRQLPSAAATDEQLLAVHSPAHVARIDFFTSQDAAQGDADLYGSPGTPLAARLAAGCVTAAALAVLDGRVQTAFALVRPPGHHAACARCSGFCLFNNVAVAARAVQAAPGGTAERRKVAIVDFDVHHGDGTQAIFEEDPSVLYISLHRYGLGFFPSTGAAEDVGSGRGQGFSVNVPWTETGLTGQDYMAAFKWVILPILAHFAPDMLFISAGFDAAAGDPLGGMALTPSAYAAMTSAMLAALPPHGRAVIALEGGYNEDAIAAAAEATVRAALRFSGASATVAPTPTMRRARTHCQTAETLRAVRSVQRRHWPCLADTDAPFDAWAAEEEAAHKKAAGTEPRHHPPPEHTAEAAPAPAPAQEHRGHGVPEPRTPAQEPL